MGEQFKAAGEAWPIAEGTSEQEMTEIMNRVRTFMMTEKVEAALAERDSARDADK
jgi:hypothetical protein